MSGHPTDGRVAIVGMACRFPGASTVDEYWHNVADGREAFTELTERQLLAGGIAPEWIAHPDYVRRAAVLDGVDEFDASFFDISAREAEIMDPQQRLFLQTAWHALEHAGLTRTHEEGSDIGVFAGAGGVLAGYLPEVLDSTGRLLEPTASLEHLGNDKDFLATKVSYRLNLTGPSLTVQTACSTSLVAVHLACQSVLNGECSAALAGGVTVRVPSVAGYLYRDGGILSPDGRCRPFDAEARGTVFGSGVGAVVLKPLADALRDGDTVYASILGTAINNDGGGKTSYGASSTLGQLTAMREAIAVSGIDPATIGYVEAHGTGTLMGDPLEVAAIGRALGSGADCAIGSVKALIGHTEAAAGVAGLIKTTLALHHGVVPPSPHLVEPNPRLNLTDSGLRLDREPRTFPGAPRRAAVNSLGIGGTNAFAVLEQGPSRTAEPIALPRETVTISARTDSALRRATRAWSSWLREERAGFADAAHTSHIGRRRMGHRIAVVAGTGEQAADELDRWLAGEASSVLTTRPGMPEPRVAFAFPGQGSQYAGMAVGLLESAPGFRETINAHAGLFTEITGEDLTDVLFDMDRLRRAELLQPAFFLTEVALARQLRAWGVHPTVVIGHSLGEYAAACVAGVLDIAEGLRFVAERGRVIAGLKAGGGMLAVRAPDPAVVEQILEAVGATHPGELAVAAYNGAGNVVFSGSVEAIHAVGGHCRDRRLGAVALDVTHAFHSPLIAPAAADLGAVARAVAHSEPDIPMALNTHGRLAAPGEIDATYWPRQLREPVRFDRCVDTLLDAGVTHVIEVGPGAALTRLGRGGREENLRWLPTLSPKEPDLATVQSVLTELDLAGVEVDWQAFHTGLGRRRIAVPGYPFERGRYWITRRDTAGHTGSPTPSRPTGEAPPLDRVALPLTRERRWETTVRADHPGFLRDHVLLGRVVVPGAYHLATLIEAVGATEVVETTDVVFPRALVVDDAEHAVQLVVMDDTARVLSLRPGAEPHQDDSWTTHAEARIAVTPGTTRPAGTAVADDPGDTPTPGDGFYERMRARGYDLGPTFRWIRSFRSRNGSARAELVFPADLLADQGRPARAVMIDSCVQTAIGHGLSVARVADDALLLPFRIERAVFAPVTKVPTTALVHAVARGEAGQTVVLDVRLTDGHGNTLVDLTGLELRVVTRAQLGETPPDAVAYHQDWQPLTPPVGVPPVDRWTVLADHGGIWRGVVEAIRARGAECRVVAPGQRPEGHALQGRGVVVCGGLDGPATGLDGVTETLVEVTSILTGPQPSVLVLLTRGGVVDGREPLHGALWGLGRTAAVEMSELDVRLVDLDPDDVAGSASRLPELLGDPAVREVALRAGTVLRPRPRRQAEPDGVPPTPRGSQLITGGLGDLGLLTATWLADRGARHIVLCGRSAPSTAARTVIDRLSASGVRVDVRSVDVTDERAVRSVVDELAGTANPVRGVFHAAGVLDDAVLTRMDADRYRRVLAPKVIGALNLHHATADLDEFVLFSSTSALLGAAGQANYAAANGVLDALALRRRGLGLPAVSVAWGPWAAGMMARLDDRLRHRMSALGYGPLTARGAFTALEAVLAGPGGHCAVVALDWSRYLARFPTTTNAPADAVPTARSADGDRGGIDALRARLFGADTDRRESAQAYLRALLADRLGLDRVEIEPTGSLARYGMDSMIAVEFRGQLRADLGVELPLNVMLDADTVEGLTDALLDLLTAPGSPAMPVATATRPAGGPPVGGITAESAAELLAELDDMSEAELAELAARLAADDQERQP